MFRFEDSNGTAIAGIPDDDWGEPDPDAFLIGLNSFFAETERCSYLYDFGDGWEHDIKLRRTVELREVFHRRLIDGARAFPPEDCGGVGGYEVCVVVARGGPDPEGLSGVDG